jgi:hypothetical protein
MDDETIALNEEPSAASEPFAESDGLDDQLEAQAEADADVLEDVEHEGRTYQVPRALKRALMMHGDYTRKTQELADQRRELEAERVGHAEAAEARAALTALEQKLAALDAVDWQTLQAEDPQGAERLWRHGQELAQARDHMAGELEDWGRRRALADQHEHAAKVREGHAVLERELADWSPQLARQLAAFAVDEFGVSPQELAEVHDPRLVKLIHAAYVGANASRTNKAAARHEQAQASKPAASVGGRGAAGKDPNRMTTDEWMRHRNNQLRRAR